MSAPAARNHQKRTSLVGLANATDRQPAETSAVAPLVFVIVLNCNGRKHLEYSLPSICGTEYENLCVLVVDNGSRDDSLEVARRFPVEVVANGKNLGWSGGNNVGIRNAMAAGAVYVILANNDIKVDRRWVREAVRLAEVRPEIAVIGFDVHEPLDDSDRDAGFTDACRVWSEPMVTSPEFVGGMAMFARVRAFEELGLIDENFFVYGEENDFQLRVRRAGGLVAGINVPIWHFGQGFFGRTSFRASLLQTENNIQLLLKHRGLSSLGPAAIRHALKRFTRRPARHASSVERRLAAGNVARAAVISVLAVLRIASRLPAILRRKREDDRRIALSLRAKPVSRP